MRSHFSANPAPSTTAGPTASHPQVVSQNNRGSPVVLLQSIAFFNIAINGDNHGYP